MPGYRGIFLDSIHPNIVKRLDSTTLGFQRLTNGSSEDSIDIFRYLNERTPWMRVVPFAVPDQTQPVFTDINNQDYDLSNVAPDWKDWVFYGTKAASGGTGTFNIQGQGGPAGLYRGFDDVAWDGEAYSGFRTSPKPGITSLQVSNKGDLGTIRRASFNIKAHSLPDLEAIEMMYMIPGMSVLIEFGWYHSQLFQNPIALDDLVTGNLTTRKDIGEEILRKTFDVDDLLNFNDPLNTNNQWNNVKSGIYDGLLGVVTKFNWTNASDGTYDCRIDIIAPGSLATGIPTDTFLLGATQKADLKGVSNSNEFIPVTDVEAVVASVMRGSRNIEASQTKEALVENVQTNFTDIRLVDDNNNGTVTLESGVSIALPSKKLDINGGAVKITKDKDGNLVFEPIEGKDPEQAEYYVGAVGNGESYEAQAIKGDPDWWPNIQKDFKRQNLWNEDVLIANSGIINEEAIEDLEFASNNFDKADILMSAIEKKYGLAFKNGDWYTKKSNSTRGWDIVIKVNGVWEDQPFVPHDINEFNANRQWFRPYKVFLNNFNEDQFSVIKTQGNSGFTINREGAASKWFDGTKWFNPKGKHRPHIVDPSTGKKVKFIEKISNREQPDGIKRDYTRDEEGIAISDTKNVATDSTGNVVASGNDWGANANDPVVYSKKKGVSVYKKTSEGTELIASTETEDATSLLDQIKQQIQTQTDEKIQEADITAKEDIDAAAEVVQRVQNPNILSWGPSNESIAFSNNSIPEIPTQIYSSKLPKYSVRNEIGYKTRARGGYNPIGAVAYGETYVSIRFIEDYIINELYMPKVSREDGDKTVEEIDQLFSSTTDLSDLDKIKFNKHSDRIELDSNGNLTNKTLEISMVKSDYIFNHTDIRSFNPLVCILPGQENQKGLSRFNTNRPESRILFDANTNTAPWVKDLTFAPKSADNLEVLDYNAGVLRNILVNIDVVQSAARKSPNVRKFMTTILDAINQVCGEPWSFKILSLSSNNQLKVIDENYVSDFTNKATRMQSNQDENGIYKFSGIGSDNICKDVKIQTKIPNELQTMAYYSAIGENKSRNTNIHLFNMYKVGMVDRLRNISKTTIASGTTPEDKKRVEEQLIKSYATLFKQSRREVLLDFQKTPAATEGAVIAKEYVNRFIKGVVTVNSGYRPPIPIDVSLTLDGISGVFMGNGVMIKTIKEGGLLPSRYKDIAALQITNVSHDVTPESWTTSIDTLMRPIPSDKQEVVQKIEPIEEEEVVVDEFVNANKLRAAINELKTPNYNIYEKIKGGYEQGEISSGGDITPLNFIKSKEIFTKLKTALQGIKVELRVTGGNDKYHQNKGGTSRHITGKGMDFVIRPYNNETRTIVENTLGSISQIKYINEYERVTKNRTADHFHYEVI